ncbi:putative elongation factor 1-alpha [Neospora caninum Liverpool]|uniref:Elongation factor 1-alpha, putative n=1 Tax=Neospora caninum (strain Liverpool) TaxID=572307 RepID=F0V8N0_NEOCL|nr:putative elongation factor 1-alpha [Neospora caninum Liverpool]CBZ50071.1 putative elongation factor 1-alpha [Neospora caninum Liverpool]CEL64665.1 TPA: elongation factor 1-alpha, putative [Neospora caninum Liverpool]|eukprot:XP_003880106.1 putative elongation factor 1-alpha [Neospora caninum Liverpool]
MSGRRRVKNVAYDEDEWGYNDDEYWDEDDYDEPEALPRCTPTQAKKSTPAGASTRVPATKASSTPPLGAKDTPSRSGEKSTRGGRGAGTQQSASTDSKSGASGTGTGAASQEACAPNPGLLGASAGTSPAKPPLVHSSGTNALSSASPSSLRTPGTPEPLSLVVIGHVDAGKSTLIGQMLLSTGTVEEKVVQKMKKMSGEAGKGSFFLAWLCDEGEDERERGVTIDVSVRVLVTPNTGRRLALVDAPGHREFVCNMLGGAALADVALLVVDAARFDVGFSGQTKEHLLIGRCLGIQHFVVALNKMDELGWSEEIYRTTVERLRDYMVGPEMNCAPDQISFVPISAFRGVNVVNAKALEAVEKARAEGKKRKPDLRGLADAEEREQHAQALAKWWKGPAVLEAIENVEMRTRDDRQRLLSEPLAACVADAWSPSASSTDLHLSFKIVRGVLRVGDTVVGLPGDSRMVCRSLVSFGEALESCEAGDFVERGVFAPACHQGSQGAVDVGVGSVLCARAHPLPVATVCLCRVMVFGTDLPLVQGRQFVAHIHTFTCACSIRKVAGVINKRTGELQGATREKRSACAALGRGMVGLVEIVTASSVCVQVKTEKQDGKDVPTSVLSRIILRDRGRTVAAGVILSAA